MRTNYHLIGENINKEVYGDKTFYYNRPYGCELIVAMANYGKSSLAKHMCVKMANEGNRKQIIFDISSEWENSITVPNYDSSNPDAIKQDEILILRNVTLKISDLSSSNDWSYLGFDGRSAEHISRIVNDGFEYFEDDPIKFINMLNEIPRTDKVDKESGESELTEWNEKYPKLMFLRPPHPEISRAIVDKFAMMRGRFYDPFDKKEERIWIEDWFKTIKDYKVVLIDLNISNIEANAFWGGCIVGHILDKLRTHLIYLRANFWIEEADYIAGNPEYGKYYTKATDLLITYVKKYRKRGAKVHLITQTFSGLHPELYINRTISIFGAIDKSDSSEYFEWADKLKYDLDKGEREFYIHDRTKKQYKRFIPIISCCNVETMGAKWIK